MAGSEVIMYGRIQGDHRGTSRFARLCDEILSGRDRIREDFAKAGLSPYRLKEIMGHASIETTMRSTSFRHARPSRRAGCPRPHPKTIALGAIETRRFSMIVSTEAI
jgi:hypothetical protein